MRHSRRFSFVTSSLVVTAVALSAACGDRKEATTDDTLPDTSAVVLGLTACAPSSESVRRMTRREFVRWAATIEYDSVVDPLAARPHGSGTGGISVYRARDMDAVTPEAIQDGCLIARIRSTTADAALGLGVGWTYVWADSTNPYTATMVPEQETTAVTTSELSLLPGEPDPATILSPRYVCSDCGQGWCVYPRDETRLPPEAFQGELGLAPPQP